MRIIDVILSALSNLFRRKVRTILTIVGVVVGAAAIIVMISLGLGMNASLDNYIESMGDLTMIELNSYVWMPSEGNSNDYVDKQNQLNDALIEKIRTLNGVLAVSPYFEMYEARVVANRIYQAQYAYIIGVDPAMLPYLNIPLDRGEMPTPGNKNFLLIGSDTQYEFRNPNKPIKDWYREFYNSDGTRKPAKVDLMTASLYLTGQGRGTYDEYGNYTEQASKVKKYYISEVAIMGESTTNYYTRYAIYAHIDLVKELSAAIKRENSQNGDGYYGGGVIIGGGNGMQEQSQYSKVMIKTKDIGAAESVQAELNEMGIYTYGLSDMRKTMQNSQKTTQIILGCIGAMSLIVAAIGIANTMVMSIYERTREIGIMKVLGCKIQNIKTMFLIEASSIGLLGGIIGVGLSLLVSNLMNTYLADSSLFGSTSNPFGDMGIENIVSVVPAWLILLSIAFSTLVGLISGYLPARRATKISALEAIKNEG